MKINQEPHKALLFLNKLDVNNQKSEGVNWNKEEDDYTEHYWNKNIGQFWTDTEFVPSLDKPDWDSNQDMQKYKNTYKKVLSGLTVLDTKQGNVGVPSLVSITESLQGKALLTFMAMMEQIHAKSYSTIFTTLLSNVEVDEMFKWANENVYIQYKSDVIHHYYNIESNDRVSRYMKHVASVMLESFLFYSGFFLPLYLSGGMGLMIHSGIVIKKIQDDEKLHGGFIGMKAQDIYENELTVEERRLVDRETEMLIEHLYANEIAFTRELYSEIGLFKEVEQFLQYNLNHALENLGKDIKYPNAKINSAVENALSDETTTGDLFSVKLKKYFKAISRPLEDKDFQYILEELI